MLTVFNSPPNFDDYVPNSAKTDSVINYFTEEFGGPSFLELTGFD